MEQPSPIPAEIIAPEKVTDTASRDLRLQSHESIMGFDNQGRKKIGQVFRDAVLARLDRPDDLTITRPLTRRHIFTELHGANKGVQSILSAHETSPMDEAKLASLLRPKLHGVYVNRTGGEEEFKKFLEQPSPDSDKRVIADSKDFAGTIARELFMGELLKRVGVENKFTEERAEICSSNDPEKRVSRKKLIKNAIESDKARSRTWRELGRLKHRLKLIPEDKVAVDNAFIAQNINDEGEGASVDKATEKTNTRLALEKRTLKTITGEDLDQPIEATSHSDVLENVRKRSELFDTAAEAQVQLLAERRKLEATCRSLKTKDIVNGINEERKAELQYKVAANGIKTLERRERRRIKLKDIRTKGVEKLDKTEGVLLGESIANFTRELASEAKNLPSDVGQKIIQSSESTGHNLAEAAQRSIGFLKNGLDRVNTRLFQSTEAQIDRVISFGRNVRIEYMAMKGSPDIQGKMRRSEAFHAYKPQIDIPTDAIGLTALLDSNPVLKRQFEELQVQRNAEQNGADQVTPDAGEEVIDTLPTEVITELVDQNPEFVTQAPTQVESYSPASGSETVSQAPAPGGEIQSNAPVSPQPDAPESNPSPESVAQEPTNVSVETPTPSIPAAVAVESPQIEVLNPPSADESINLPVKIEQPGDSSNEPQEPTNKPGLFKRLFRRGKENTMPEDQVVQVGGELAALEYEHSGPPIIGHAQEASASVEQPLAPAFDTPPKSDHVDAIVVDTSPVPHEPTASQVPDALPTAQESPLQPASQTLPQADAVSTEPVITPNATLQPVLQTLPPAENMPGPVPDAQVNTDGSVDAIFKEIDTPELSSSTLVPESAAEVSPPISEATLPAAEPSFAIPTLDLPQADEDQANETVNATAGIADADTVPETSEVPVEVNPAIQDFTPEPSSSNLEPIEPTSQPEDLPAEQPEAPPATDNLEATASDSPEVRGEKSPTEELISLKLKAYEDLTFAATDGYIALAATATTDDERRKAQIAERAVEHFKTDESKERFKSESLDAMLKYTDQDGKVYEKPFFLNMALALQKETDDLSKDNASKKKNRSQIDKKRAQATLLTLAAAR